MGTAPAPHWPGSLDTEPILEALHDERVAMLTVCWGNRLEVMADDLLGHVASVRTSDPSALLGRSVCILTPNRIQQAWLQHRFLYDDRSENTGLRVLANCEFTLLNSFVSQWLSGEDASVAEGTREHPFSVKAMRWRIHALLMQGGLSGDFAALQRYVTGPGTGGVDERLCFKLAGRIAKMLDEYMLYRPEMLVAWERNQPVGLDETTRWQATLWRMLVVDHEGTTPLSALLRMQRDIGKSGLHHRYRSVLVFAPSMVPRVYLAFFRYLAERLPVRFYLFNPAEGDWCDLVTLRTQLREAEGMEMPGDPGPNPVDVRHPLLSAYARGARDLVAAAIDLTQGEVQDMFASSGDDHLLAGLADGIQRGVVESGATMVPDASVQLHLCHGKMREVTILYDQLIRCFADFPGLQAREIQVQVADMNAYAPYIDAVFGAATKQAGLPYVIADRVMAAESPAVAAFRQLLTVLDSRFTAPDVMDILRCPLVAEKFELEPAMVDELMGWVGRAGIRWGRDAEHREDVSKARFEEATTWRYGLDRLMLGYAMGRSGEGMVSPSGVVPCDCVEGHGALLLGRLIRFYKRLEHDALTFRQALSADQWVERMEMLVSSFFVDDDRTYAQLGMIRSAIRLLKDTVTAASFDGPLSLRVIRDFLLGRLGEVERGSGLKHNAIVFNALRAGSSAPRRVMALMGMGDGIFPRAEGRPAYDVLRGARKMGDRDAGIEDRMAFLEALLNARDRLLISYQAFSDQDDARPGESILLRELVEYIEAGAGGMPIHRVQHRLQAFDPAYFTPTSNRLFSYSDTNAAAAQALVMATEPDAEGPICVEPIVTLDLEELQSFFHDPVKFFYRHTLNVAVTPALGETLSDEEVFAPDALEAYSVRSRLLAAALMDAPPEDDALYRLLAADGLVPLGEEGRQWCRDEVETIRQILMITVERVGGVGAAVKLMRNPEIKSCSVEVPIEGRRVRITGALPGTVCDGQCVGVDFQCATPKTTHRFGAWLKTLLAAAAGESVAFVSIQGKQSKKLECYTYRAPDEPADLLSRYVGVMLTGITAPLPFHLDLAGQYAADQRQGQQPPSQNPLDKVRKAWSNKSGLLPSLAERSPHLVKAFGAEGPLAGATQFVEYADAIMGPMLAHEEKLGISKKRGVDHD